MKSLLKYSVLVLVGVALSACPPRGETKTMDEVVAIAKQRFQQVDMASLTEDVKASMQTLSPQLDEMLSAEDAAVIAQKAKVIGEGIAALIDQAGYTSRPGLNELVNQYRGLANKENGTNAQAAMLVARTYSAVAAELETTKFGVK